MQKEIEHLEEKVRSNWHQLKESITPSTIAKGALNKVLHDKTEDNMNGESVLKSTFTYGISLLAKKLADKAEEKFDHLFKKE